MTAMVNASTVSFVDRLVRAIGRLPYGGWWLYVVLVILVGAWLTIVRWWSGVAPVGEVDLTALTPVLFGFYALALIQYLDGVADRAVTAFAPALDPRPEEVRRWRSELTTLPSRPAAIAALIGGGFALFLLAGTPPAIYLVFTKSLIATAVLVGPVVVFGFGGFAVLLYHTWHQLRTVVSVHRAATRIDLFRSAPLFAFSRLTARTGLGYLLYLYYGLTINGDFSKAAPATLWPSAIVPFVAFACFVVPLLGIHGRLVTARDELLAQTEERIRVVSDELHRRIDAGGLTKMTEIDGAIHSLTSLRDLVRTLPTWPWSAALFRGFVTAMLLPLTIWFITRILGTVLGM